MFPNPFSIAISTASGWRSVKVPGRNPSVGQTFVPVAPGGVYRTPQVSGAANLRIRSGGNANDTAAGTGARQIRLSGLNAAGEEISETLATAGASASAATSQKFLRLHEAEVSLSGTYATQTAGSHAGDITIEDTAGNLWSEIPLNTFPEGRTRIGAFTLPVNYEGYLIGFRINAAAGKQVDALLFKREGILQTSAPYEPMAVITELFDVTGFLGISYDAPIYLPPLTDVGIMTVIDVQTAQVSTELGLLLRRIK